MDLRDVGLMSGGCEGKNCSFTSSFSENCSNQDCFWEEPMFGLVELVSVTVIYIPLMLFGLLGNILTILVVWLRPHMRSSTYLYLSSMAVSDLLILLLLPLDLYKLWRPRPWPLGDLACKLTMFLSECCTFCTILHITFLSLERYLAVCWPITAKTMVTRHRTRVIIGCLWLGAAVSAAPVLVMVGVEDIGVEELGLSQWREDGGWTGREGEHGEFMTGGGEIAAGTHMVLMDAGLELGEKETKGWDEEFRELKNKSGAVTDWKREGKTKDGKGAYEEEWDIESVGEQQNKKKEDEGGGEQRTDGGSEGEIDRRECRCTHYAISSGLLAAMMVLSNLYFLVPLCILGLVYSLIGRTLWLRPKSSRRDQNHRNTVKMLGMIVLAFVLCWLPFHVGRTILSLSLGSGADRQEASLDTNPHFDALTDMRTMDPEPFSHTDRRLFESLSQPGEVAVVTPSETGAGLCDQCASTKATTHNYLSPDEHLTSHVSGLDSGNTNLHLHPAMKTKTHNDYLLVNTQKGNINHFYNTTNTNSSTHTYTAVPTDLHTLKTHNDSHPDAHTYFLYYLSQYFNLVSSVLFYLSAAVNPLLYNLMSARYRLAVHSLFHKHSHSHTHRLRTLTSRHSTTTL